MRMLLVAVGSGLIAAMSVLAFHELAAHEPLPATPDMLTGVDASRGGVAADLDRLRQDVGDVSRRLETLQATLAAPARADVAPPSPELVALEERMTRIEQQVASLMEPSRTAGTQGDHRASVASETERLKAELDQRLAAIDRKNAPALVQLADWAESQGLKTDSKRMLRLAVKADPDNAVARERLGYQRHEGKWRTAAEIERLELEGR